MVPHDLLVQNLYKLNIDPRIFIWIGDYLNLRKQYVLINGVQSSFIYIKQCEVFGHCFVKKMLRAAHFIRNADILCQNCFSSFKQLAKKSTDTSVPDEGFARYEAAVEHLNGFVQSTKCLPLKSRTEWKSHCCKPYARREQKDIESVLVKKLYEASLQHVESRMSPEPRYKADTSVQSRSATRGMCSIRLIQTKNDAVSWRCSRGISPSNRSKKMIPSATRQLIQKTRKNQGALGKWWIPDT